MKNLYLLIILLFFILSCTSIKTKQNVASDYFNLGNEYMDLKNYQKAINSYEKALQYNPNFGDSILNLIYCYQANKEYDKVEKKIITYYKRWDLKIDNQKLLLILANNFFLQDKYNQAVKTYEEYIIAYPDDPNGYFNLGITYLKLLDEDKAFNYFFQASEKSKKDGKYTHIPSLYNIAEYYYKKNNLSKSYEYYKILEELDNKKTADIYYKLGLIEFKNEEFENAKIHLSTACDLDIKNKDYFIMLAKVYAKGYKNKVKTIENLEKALKNGFNDLKFLQSTNEFKLLNEFEDYKELLKKYNIK